ncbi:hypothetical protein SeMB42_g07590 [Synchytrium endobioticum]|uniref:Uncharacterized protein n=1 Tax=Synchytrium endobioticum TaxID=286115 RepID=A0A507D8R7_9FUNG|nr:hypothetical protein SeMB42_g07590 [Synchytrium endobioticum]TPX47923.1 hypothetical protein SeLEV6574_g02378 [Synchytrium endobioticum]
MPVLADHQPTRDNHDMPTKSSEPVASTSTTAPNRPRPPPRRRTHIALRGVFPKRKAKPCIEPDGLGVVERVFYNIKPGKPQVIMGCAIRLKNPAIFPHISPERILELIKIAASAHYRLCISLDPQTLRGIHLADTAADLPISYRVVDREKEDTWQEVVLQDINTNFDLKDITKPLWRVSLVMPKQAADSNCVNAEPNEAESASLCPRQVPVSAANSIRVAQKTTSHHHIIHLPPIDESISASDATDAPTIVNQITSNKVHDDRELSNPKGKSVGPGGPWSPPLAVPTTIVQTLTNSEIVTNPVNSNISEASLVANSSSTTTPRRRRLSRPALSHSLSRFFTAPAGLTLPTRSHMQRPTSQHQTREWTVGNWKVEWPGGQPFPRLVRVNPEESVEMLQQPEPPADGDPIELLFTFNHLLGDGLSMWAFMRSFFDIATPDRLSPGFSLNLKDFPCEKVPPPLIDNLLRPNVLEITPIAFGMVRRFITRRGHHTFRGRTKSSMSGLKLSARNTNPVDGSAVASSSNENMVANDNVSLDDLDNTAVNMLNHNDTKEQIHNIRHCKPTSSSHRVPLAEEADERIELGPEMASPLDPLGPPAEPLFTLPSNGKTRARFLSLDHDFTEALRKKCNSEKTTVAAAVVVAALSAVRTLAETMPAYANGKRSLPTRQGWVVTSSVRHLLPNHTSLYGGERAEDPSLKIFGGYGGSIFNNNLRFVDGHDFWERCRRVKRDIRLSYRTSIMRMKLVNWCFRHQSVWEWINKRANLSKLSRAYSVELANLGAWDAPCALSGVGESDPRFRLAGFSGILNSSFDGVRGLFCIGTMSLSGAMSITVAYDVGAVLEQDADLFVSTFLGVLHRAAKAPGKLTVKKARLDVGTIPRPRVINGYVVTDKPETDSGIDTVNVLSMQAAQDDDISSNNNNNNNDNGQTLPTGEAPSK